MESSVLGIIFSVLAAITWGINSHILAHGAQTENQYMGMVYRVIVSFPFLLGLALYFRNPSVFLAYLDPYLLLLVFLLVFSIITGDVIFMYAMRKYPVSVILPIATSYPLMTTGVLILFGIEQVSFLIISGTISVVLGIYLVTSNRYDEETSEKGINLEALLLGLGVGFGWGMTAIFARLILNRPDAETFGLLTVRTVIIGVVSFMIYYRIAENRQEFRNKSVDAKLSSLKIFGLSGIFSWVLGSTFLFLAYERIRTAVATPISASNPIIAVIIGQFTGIDKINIKQFAGILLATVGVILIVV